MDSVQDVYGKYYEAKGRTIPRHSSLTESTRILWKQMEDQAHKVTYENGSMDVLDECVERLASHPECTWDKKVLNYYLRQTYWK